MNNIHWISILYVNRSPVPRKPGLEDSFCTQIMLKVTQERMHTIFEIPSTLCGKKFTQHEIFSVFWLSLKCREIRFLNKTARFCSFYDICKSFVRQEQSQKKLKQWPFGNLGTGIPASALALYFFSFLLPHDSFLLKKQDTYVVSSVWLVRITTSLLKQYFPTISYNTNW